MGVAKTKEDAVRAFLKFFQEYSDIELLQENSEDPYAKLLMGKVKTSVPRDCIIELIQFEAVRAAYSSAKAIAPLKRTLDLGERVLGERFANTPSGVSNGKLQQLIDQYITLSTIVLVGFEAGRLRGDFNRDRLLNTLSEVFEFTKSPE